MASLRPLHEGPSTVADIVHRPAVRRIFPGLPPYDPPNTPQLFRSSLARLRHASLWVRAEIDSELGKDSLATFKAMPWSAEFFEAGIA
jgi:hypothetical protein